MHSCMRQCETPQKWVMQIGVEAAHGVIDRRMFEPHSLSPMKVVGHWLEWLLMGVTPVAPARLARLQTSHRKKAGFHLQPRSLVVHRLSLSIFSIQPQSHF